ncbi:MAG: tRNA pseudouridine(13) synthase TruD [Gammaproteobacteria bacterium]|nr:tRNA pseudouridine(13) synthase TruD [Gammaproteobacteria bacterium]
MFNSHYQQLAYANSVPLLTAGIKSSPHDFQVDEYLSFELDGQGTHDYLLIRKQHLNTEEVVSCLSKHARVKPVAIGYAGLKDKNAITSQWFSVNLAGKKQPDWQALNNDQLQVVTVQKHSRKLKRGAIKNNRFQVILRNLTGDRSSLESRINNIQQTGVPNYFGEQRFGRSDANLKKALKLFANKVTVKNNHQRGLYLSAARSYLFNQVLSRRVAEGSWNNILAGEACVLDGSNSFFVSDCITSVDEAIMQRLAHWDLHPSGPLWGAGDLPTAGIARALEEQVMRDYAALCNGLAEAGLKQQRRSLRLNVQSLQWETLENNILLKFDLVSGSYATVVIREIVQQAKQ